MTPKNPHAQQLGKLGGQARTPRKAAASAANGRKGGTNWKTVALQLKTALEVVTEDLRNTLSINGIFPDASTKRALSLSKDALAAIPTGPKQPKEQK